MHHIETDFPKCLSGVNKFLRLNRLELAAKSYVFHKKGLTISKQILRFEYTLSILCRYCFRITEWINQICYWLSKFNSQRDFDEYIKYKWNKHSKYIKAQFTVVHWWYTGRYYAIPYDHRTITYRGIHACTTKKYIT